MTLTRFALAAAVLATAPSPADALCIHKGELYARTTLPQEFREARWVVRAKVTSAKSHWSDEAASWTVYRLKVERAYKGRPPGAIRLFTYRNSGGFYLDHDNGPDVGGEYLLFLNRNGRHGISDEAFGTAIVN